MSDNRKINHQEEEPRYSNNKEDEFEREEITY